MADPLFAQAESLGRAPARPCGLAQCGIALTAQALHQADDVGWRVCQPRCFQQALALSAAQLARWARVLPAGALPLSQAASPLRTLGDLAHKLNAERAAALRPNSAKRYAAWWARLHLVLPADTPLAAMTREMLLHRDLTTTARYTPIPLQDLRRALLVGHPRAAGCGMATP